MRRQKVNLFIVGAPKCGTTYLFEYLKKTNECDMSSIKEPDFFSHDIISQNTNYYKTHPIQFQSEYHRLFSWDKNCIYHGEASVSYFTYSKVAEKIHQYNPHARIIILMRNPASRALSHYRMDKRLGYIKTSFDSIIRREYTGKSSDQFYYQYITTGYYSKHISTYLDLFGENQVCCVIDSTNMSKTIEKVSNFLNIPLQNVPLTRINQSLTFKNKILKQLYAIPRIRKVLKKITPNFLVNLAINESESPPEKQKKELMLLYEEDQKKLMQLLDHE